MTDTPAQPTYYEAIAADLGLSWTATRLDEARATHAGLRPDLLRLRGLPLPFTPSTGVPVDEPETAQALIRTGRP